MKKQSFFLIVLLMCSAIAVLADTEKITSLKNKLASSKEDSDKIKILGDLSWEYLQTEINQSEKYALQEMELSKKVNKPVLTALANNDLGIVRMNQGSYNDSLELTQRALDIRKSLGDELGVASSYNKLGTIYTKQNKYTEALNVNLESCRIFEKLGLKKNMAYALNNIAHIYSNIGNTKKSMEYYQKALAINRELGNKQGIATNLFNIGNFENKSKHWDAAMIYLNESYQIFTSLNDHYSRPSVISAMAYNYEHRGNLSKALQCYQDGINEAELMKDTTNIIGLNNFSAGIYLQQNNTKAAKICLDRAMMLIQVSKQYFNLKECYKMLFQYYNVLGDAEKAEMYFQKYDSIKDATLNEKLTAQVTEMGTKYESAKKEEENKLLKKDNQIKSLSLWFLVVGLILVIATFYLIYNRYKLKQQSLFQQELLKQQELRSKAVLEAEEHERQRIAKDLHDGIGQMLSAVKLNLSSVQKKTTMNEEQNTMMENAISLVDDSVKEVRTISHNMMPNMLIKKGLVNAVREFIDKLSGTSLKIDLEVSGMNERLDAALESILYRVLQELINNIIKHAAASHITIQLLRFENEVTLMVEDNGKGFDVQQTMNSDKGIGLKNIISRVDYFKGETHFDSTVGKGTTVSIEVPV